MSSSLSTVADFMSGTAAKGALRRKKNFEHQLEQTSAQILTIEREISSIETANINKETLDAMKNASAAMKHIHGGLTVDKVDQTMLVSRPPSPISPHPFHHFDSVMLPFVYHVPFHAPLTVIAG